jgi:hypothetical protein
LERVGFVHGVAVASGSIGKLGHTA